MTQSQSTLVANGLGIIEGSRQHLNNLGLGKVISSWAMNTTLLGIDMVGWYLISKCTFFFNHILTLLLKKKRLISNLARQEPAILIICINLMCSLQLFHWHLENLFSTHGRQLLEGILQHLQRKAPCFLEKKTIYIYMYIYIRYTVYISWKVQLLLIKRKRKQKQAMKIDRRSIALKPLIPPKSWVPAIRLGRVEKSTVDPCRKW